MLTSIPKVIWQTASSATDIPLDGVNCMGSWSSLNPSWVMRFADDQDIRRFFQLKMPEFLETFDQLPLGVMKADFWRYAVIYRHGGVYADVDTTCTQPLETWLSDSDNRLHVAWEDSNPYFCQWMFAAPAKHPILLETLHRIASRVKADGGVNPLKPEYVHYYTGPSVWTDAIHEFIRRESQPSYQHRADEMWRKECLVIYPPGYFTWGPVQHSFASFNWKQSEYSSWRMASQALVRNASQIP